MRESREIRELRDVRELRDFRELWDFRELRNIFYVNLGIVVIIMPGWCLGITRVLPGYYQSIAPKKRVHVAIVCWNYRC